jgi:hypothetical protein
MSIEAMKQALAKFEHLWEIGIDVEYKVELLPEIRILRQAIEQAEKQTHTDHPMRHWDRTCPACVAEAEKQEPVAWMYIEPDNEFKTVHIDDCDYSQFPNDEWFPVYTAPPKREWIGLTDEEMSDTYNRHYNDYASDDVGIVDFIVIARAIEAKLKEKNNG